MKTLDRSFLGPTKILECAFGEREEEEGEEEGSLLREMTEGRVREEAMAEIEEE